MVEMLVSGTVVFLMDQAAKRAAEVHAATRVIRCGSLFSIRHGVNKRSVYALFPARVFLSALWLAALVSALLLANSPAGQFTSRVALGAALGGAAGNLSDILRTKSVRDFIDLGWWPVFNVADVAIIAGLAFTFLLG